MPKTGNKITIDFDQWQTQKQYAEANGIRLGTLSQQVKRLKVGEVVTPSITIWHIEQLGITLVKK